MSLSPFGPIYERIALPADLGYDAEISIRVNPTKSQWADWLTGSDAERGESQDRRTEREAAIVRALHALYGGSMQPAPLSFGTIEAAQDTWDNPDVPDELWVFLLNLPWQVIAKRRDAILKNVYRSSQPQTSIETSQTTTE